MLKGSDNKLGYRIKAARENRKWTQEQLDGANRTPQSRQGRRRAC